MASSRVAIGRAIVRAPKIFLFDEPLSNLDAALRGQTRAEIHKLHRALGVRPPQASDFNAMRPDYFCALSGDGMPSDGGR